VVIAELDKTARTVAVHAGEGFETEVFPSTARDLVVLDRFRTVKGHSIQWSLPVTEQERWDLAVLGMGHNPVAHEQIQEIAVYLSVCNDLKAVPLLATVPLMGQAVNVEHSL